MTVVSFIPIIGQGLKLLQIGFKAAAKAVMVGLISAAAPIIAREVIKYFGPTLLMDLATEWLGEDLGNALRAGANTLLAANHQTGGGSPGSREKVAQFTIAQDAVLAEEARYQRSVRSPFDITSQYTFLGSIIYSMIPMANSAGVGNAMRSMGSLFADSVRKLLPRASAAATNATVTLAAPNECPTLEMIGVQGDVYCNPLYITDESTIGGSLSPTAVIEQEKNWGYVKEVDGKLEVVDADNNLTKYITYCGQRTSSWGIADANIANAISSSVPGGLLSAIPLVGDALEVANAAVSITNLPWTTGSACIASSGNGKWNELKIHQRFIEDQRLLEGTGRIDNNAIAVYLEKYYEKNPLDNSFEGVLARYSGMTKDDVIANLELLDGLVYLANYHPEERIAFGEEEPETFEIYIEESITDNNFVAMEPKYIIYSDIRNRVMTV
jgi:hypothetical protein